MTRAGAQTALAAVGLAPRGLTRVQAAAYVGVSPNTFDAMVQSGQMPAPKQVGDRLIWDLRRVDEAFSALPDRGGGKSEAGDDIWGRFS